MLAAEAINYTKAPKHGYQKNCISYKILCNCQKTYYICVTFNFLSNLLCVYSGEPHPPVLNLDHYLLQINNNLYNMNSKLEDLEEQLEQTTRKLEESKHETVSEISYLQTSLNAAHSKLDNMNNKLQVLYERQQQTASEISHLNTTLNACNSKLDSIKSQSDQVHYKLDSTLSKLDLAHSKLDSTQYKQDSTHSKLDSLTATTAQLSSDHQQIQANISDVECLDAQESLELHQTLQNNLTHQLEKIKYDITHIYQPRIIHMWRDRRMETSCLPGHERCQYYLPLWLEYDWVLQKDLWESY